MGQELTYGVKTTHRKIALLTDGFSTPFLAKTAISLLRYRPDDIAAVIDSVTDCKTAEELFATGGDVPIVQTLADLTDIDALYIGIAPPGGKVPEEWRPVILQALQRKIDVVSGLHDFLVDDADYRGLASETGAALIDVRRNHLKETAKHHSFRNGCIRIHTVGHDCSVGKMVTALEIQRGLAATGHDAKFLATGQTGIMISGEGVPIDCVVADFVNGAAEQLVINNEHHDFLLVEGQGCISHPAFSAVTLGLLHGCAPDGLVFCYEASREQVKGFDDIDIPPLKKQMEVCRLAANLRHPCKFIGVAVNTRNLSEEQAEVEIARAESEFGLPTCDVYRTGADRLVAAAVQLREKVLSR